MARLLYYTQENSSKRGNDKNAYFRNLLCYFSLKTKVVDVQVTTSLGYFCICGQYRKRIIIIIFVLRY